MRSCFVVILGLFLAAGTCQAQGIPSSRYSSHEAYVLVGEHAERGRYTCVLRVGRNLEGELTVDRQVRWRSDGSIECSMGVVSWRLGPRLRAELTPRAVGLRGRLRGQAAATPDQMALKISGGKIWCRVDGPSGRSLAVGKRWATEVARPGTLKGRLLILAKNGLRDAFESGIDIKQRFKLTNFFHVGVGVGVRILEERHLSAERLAGLRQRPHSVYAEFEVEGGARVPLHARIPLGHGAWAQVGIQAATALRYRVTERYDLPQRGGGARTLLEDLKSATHHVVSLPLHAGEALDRTLGASHAIEGEWSVAISGALGIGHELNVVGDVVRVAATARTGGFYRIRRQLRLESTRLEGDDVRLRLSDVRGKDRGVNLRAELGALIDVTAEEIDLDDHPQAEYVDKGLDAGSGALEQILRVELKADAHRSDEEELDLAFRFDLSREGAIKAYEAAVRGDFTQAAELAIQSGSGVREEFRIFELERRTFRDAEVQVSEIVRGGARRTITIKDMLVRDDQGRTRYDVFRFQRRRDWRFLGSLMRSERDLSVELVGARRSADDPTPTSHTLRYRLELLDPVTRKGEGERIRRILAAWELPGTSATDLPMPERRFLKTRFGRTRTTLTASIAGEGVKALLSSSRERLLNGYAAAVATVTGHEVRWATREGRLRVASSHRSSRSSRRDHYRLARTQLGRAERFANAIAGLAAAETAEDWSEHLEDLCRRDGWRLEVLTALILLSPRDHVHVTAELNGERRVYLAEVRGPGYRPLRRERMRGR